jgi:hypothetical protein
MELFSAQDMFVEKEVRADVAIAKVGKDFRKHFLNVVEHNTCAIVELKVHKLLADARDMDRDGEFGILTALGSHMVVRLSDLFQLLGIKQKMFDLTRIVGYVPDWQDKHWAILAKWDPGFGFGGWDVDAVPLAIANKWPAGIQIVSL